MAKISKKELAVIIILGCGLFFVGLKFYQAQASRIPAEAKVIKLPQRAKGNPDASIKIIEFIDFQCPGCAKGSQLLDEYMEKYPGKIYVELRYFPLKMHQHGMTSARWAECAARQEKFWPFLDLLLENQHSWSRLSDPLPAFAAFAKTANVDIAQLTTCLTDNRVNEEINIDMEEGKMRAVSSTPSYFINHELVVGIKSLQARLDDLLGIKKETPPETLKYDTIETKTINAQ